MGQCREPPKKKGKEEEVQTRARMIFSPIKIGKKGSVMKGGRKRESAVCVLFLVSHFCILSDMEAKNRSKSSGPSFSRQKKKFPMKFHLAVFDKQ